MLTARSVDGKLPEPSSTSPALPYAVTGAGGILGSRHGYDPVGLGGGYTDRPNVTGKMHYPKKLDNWFDTSISSPT